MNHSKAIKPEQKEKLKTSAKLRPRMMITKSPFVMTDMGSIDKILRRLVWLIVIWIIISIGLLIWLFIPHENPSKYILK
ncbi:hypothetical protein R1T16_05600 [Flavobacterium sp. DG1-102-2]|nr:hypothetical protein [Flavobacterium sp. DG1-102-2]